MKRVFAMIIALVVIATLSVSVSAGIEPYGKTLDDGSREAVPVPKVTTAPVIDGVFDAVYDERSLVIPVTRDAVDGSNRADIGDVYGYAYFVFDDSNLYVYVDCYDKTVWNVLDYISLCTECGKQLGAPAAGASPACEHGEHTGSTNLWDDDCVEIGIDWTNSGESSRVSQYRISRSNYCSRDYDTWNLGFTAQAKVFEDGRWGAEIAFPLDTSKEGAEIGINGMIHSQESTADSPEGVYHDTIAYFNNSAEYGTFWDAPYYDYIVLGNETDPGNHGTGIPDDPAIAPPPPPAPDNGGGTVATDNGGNTTNNVGTTNNGGNTTNNGGTTNKGGNKLPQGADPIVSVVLAATAALGAAVVVKKTCFKK